MGTVNDYIIWAILFIVLMSMMAVLLYVFWQWDAIAEKLADKEEAEQREKKE